MQNIKKIGQVLSVVTLLSLTACSSQPEEDIEAVKNQRTALTMYKEAKVTLDNGLYARAIDLLNQLDSAFPFGPMSKQIQLDLIYANYKSLNAPQAIASIDRFISLNPNDDDLDYIYFMRGLVNMNSDDNMFQDMFGIDRADKNVESTRQSFQDFKTLIEKYPQSKYTADARKRMVFILDKLVRRELYVAQYYMKQGAYLAAANRGKYILENYPNSTKTENALEVMVESYQQLGLTKLAEDSKQVLRLNYPSNQLLN
ncbi:MAG: outer membrane protein assembly factor BamD [Phenylobacterium sp.]|jgi:outer membrane protein assembly factor BamD